MIPPGIISADGHICEPPNCYVNYIDPKYRDTAPRIIAQPDGTEAFVVPGMKRPVALGFTDGAGFSIKEHNDRAKRIKFADIRESAYGGYARVPYMDQDGIAAEIISGRTSCARMRPRFFICQLAPNLGVCLGRLSREGSSISDTKTGKMQRSSL